MHATLLYSNWQNLSAQLIWIYRGAPIRMRGRCEHPYQTVWLLLRGRLTVQGRNDACTVESGHWVIPPSGQDKREFSDDAEIISLVFSLRWPDGHMLYENPDVLVLQRERGQRLERTALALLRFVERNKLHAGNLMRSQLLDFRSFVRLNRLFQDWLLEYVDAMDALGQKPVLYEHRDERVLQMQFRLDTYALETPLDLKAIAGEVSLSLGHADALFSEAFGMTIRGYWDQRRLVSAQHQLRETQAPIKAIAYSLGFKEPTAFSHWFYKKEGSYPRDYRRQL